MKGVVVLLHCCEQMNNHITCNNDNFEDSNKLIYYSEIFDEYGIIIHDGGSSSLLINYCPWCGKKIPNSRRGDWFDALEKLGFDDPFNQKIPEKYNSSEWRS